MAAVRPPDKPQVSVNQSSMSERATVKPVDKKVAARVLRLLGYLQDAIPRIIYGIGKDKLIVQHEDSGKAYIIPQASFFGYRRRNIERELKTIQGIQSGLARANIDPKKSNLALGLERVQGKKGVWETEKAKGNLEKKVSEKLDKDTRLAYCRGVLNGMANLHKAGYMHGDVKLENVLFYEDDSVAVSDFGKSDNKEGVYSGNTRYGPDGTRSQKGDVYGAGICLIRILEEHVLHNETRLPTEFDKLGTKVPPAAKERRGVEQFILECPNFTRSYEQKGGFRGKVLDFKARLQSIGNRQQTPLRNNPQTIALESYIERLSARLKKAGFASEGQAKELKALLRLMTYPDPANRISMQEALTNFNTIFPK